MTARERFNDIYTTLLALKKVSSKSDFATRLGYNRSYISELFNEKKEITELFARALEDRFHVSSNWLLHGDGQMFASGYDTESAFGSLQTINEDIVQYTNKVNSTPLPQLLAEMLKDIDDLKRKDKG